MWGRAVADPGHAPAKACVDGFSWLGLSLQDADVLCPRNKARQKPDSETGLLGIFCKNRGRRAKGLGETFDTGM